MSPAWRARLSRLASLRLTLGLLLLLCATLLLASLNGRPNGSWVALPLLLLALNLMAAIATHPTFRRQAPLLIFHLALFSLLLLIGIGQLSQLQGAVEVTSGENFRGEMNEINAGPWHRNTLQGVRFQLDGFTIHYEPGAGGAQRGKTEARIRWRDGAGNLQQGIVGDHHPLVLDGYRFYTTHNKGFAGLFQWQPTAGSAMRQSGSIHFPAYPAHEHRQALEWTIPGTQHQLWSQLQFDEVILDPTRPSWFHPPAENLMVIRHGGERHELHPGDHLDLEGGRLVYQGLTTWMGFRVYHDWTLSWLFAAALVAALALGWHYWRRCAARPWLNNEETI